MSNRKMNGEIQGAPCPANWLRYMRLIFGDSFTISKLIYSIAPLQCFIVSLRVIIKLRYHSEKHTKLMRRLTGFEMYDRKGIIKN